MLSKSGKLDMNEFEVISKTERGGGQCVWPSSPQGARR